MGFAAIAIDGGLGMSERRQAQSAADFASLAALQFATACPGACTPAAAATAGASEAIVVVGNNLPAHSALQGGAAAATWAACTDPARPGAYTIVSSNSPCISFTANFDRARVKLPNVVIATTFARVIGFASINVGAFAEAAQEINTTANIVPFAFGGGSHTCLASNSAPQTIPPCDGPNNGNFGYVDIAHYGNAQLGTTTSCTNGGGLGRLPSNIALGSDHNLSVFTSGTPVNDFTVCPNRSESPNQVEVKTGNAAAETTDGLIRNANGRLRCAGLSLACTTVRGTSLDDTPLWSYLVPGACGGTTPSTRAQMEACLAGWSSGVIFTADIVDSLRFSAVPEFSSYPATGSSASYNIIRFRPVWLETIYSECNASRCNTIFSPGDTPVAACPDPIVATMASCGLVGGNWNGGTRVEGLTAFTIDLGMLPLAVTEYFPGRPGTRTFALYK
jgi:hypothetical protein